MLPSRRLRILGTRGVPARYGGFETFAEKLALFLSKRGWEVSVYCQDPGEGELTVEDWNGVRRISVPSGRSSPWATVVFDFRCIVDASRSNDLCLVLGYNTAIFCSILRLRGVKTLINMDGVEWRRSKWSWPVKAWLYLNDWSACLLANHLIADNPNIARLVETRVHKSKVTCIPYGASILGATDAGVLSRFGLVSQGFMTLIARCEPENSVIELVRGFSRRPRGVKLVVLGQYAEHVQYHRAVIAAASDEVIFLGAIYDEPVVAALRAHSIAYLHGHRVGGTNPSLLEAMGAGNPVIVHDNRFNRWVVDGGAVFFTDEDSADGAITSLLADPELRQRLSAHSLSRAQSEFGWDSVLSRYEGLLSRWLGAAKARVETGLGAEEDAHSFGEASVETVRTQERQR